MILGYLSASLSAALLAFDSSGWHGLRAGVAEVFLGWLVVVVFTFVPAFFAITYAAVSGIRSLWYYGLAAVGATLFALLFSGFLLLPLFPFAGNPGWLSGWLHALARLILAGMVAGVVFWAVAGRKCGPSNLPGES
jgi:hypothetical protein